MECKFCAGVSSAPPSMELIDTLWNVNALNEYGGILVVNELIDTLWNVNIVDKVTSSNAFSN